MTPDQTARMDALEQENRDLRARIAELIAEAKQKGQNQ